MGYLRVASVLEKAILMGERMGRIGQISNGFFFNGNALFRAKIKKNPFPSAESAPSVLPLYRFFQKGNCWRFYKNCKRCKPTGI